MKKKKVVKMSGKMKNLKAGVTPKKISANTMSPKTGNAADRDLGKLTGRG